MTRTIEMTNTYCLENSKNNKWNNTLKTYNNNLHGLVSILEILDISCNNFHEVKKTASYMYLSSIFNF